MACRPPSLAATAAVLLLLPCCYYCLIGSASTFCIKTCAGLSDGDYPSCLGCDMFAMCIEGQLYDNVMCPKGLTFDATKKRCSKRSRTCQANSTGTPSGGPRNNHDDEPISVKHSVNGSEVEENTPDLTNPEQRAVGTGSVDGNPPTARTAQHDVDAAGDCVTSCKGVTDGDYQSCLGCHVFATCKNGTMHDNRACAEPNVWDDRIKQCSITSSTCGTSHGACVVSCEGVTSGQYQSCLGCHLYVTCPEMREAECADDFVWDDDKKKCVRTSSTCNYGARRQRPPGGLQPAPTLTGGDTGTAGGLEEVMERNSSTSGRQTSCIGTCENMPDGVYQSCWGCHIYVTCAAGTLRVHSCPANDLSWDDHRKDCVPSSVTCGPGFGGCVRACGSLHDGNYQSCDGCHVYVTCSRGVVHTARPCPMGLVWDDLVKWCVKSSSTCQQPAPPATSCVTSCEERPDGYYASCNGCTVHVSCVNGTLDEKPCPNGLEFDAYQSMCVENSTTCSADDLAMTSFGVETLNATSGAEGNFQWEGHVGDGVCVSSCASKLNGDYQSCQGCNMFAACLNGVLYDRRPCPDGLVWEDTIKHCQPTSSTCEPGRGGCVSSCTHLSDGEYQSCKGCHVYASCQGGILEDGRPCPRRELWDDNRKRCEKTSVTCPGLGERGVPAGVCITSCEGRLDGDYQSCLGCTGYVTCTGGKFHNSRPCPTGLVWDDTKRRCRYTSPTCHPGRGMCTRTCNGLSDGDYQSCLGCGMYITCSDHVLHDGRPCPRGLLWDDTIKRCMRTSPTCGGRGHQGDRSRDSITEVARHHGSSVQAVPLLGCVTSCDGLSDGNYQSCHDCRVYVTCNQGVASDDRPCPEDTFWDDAQKRCLRTSRTCSSVIVLGDGIRQPSGGWSTRVLSTGQQNSQRLAASGHSGTCIQSCTDRENGDYQSCIDCRVFATCLHGVLHDARPCPRATVWDDTSKRCMYDSPTCHLPGHRPPSPHHRRPRPQVARVHTATRSQPPASMPIPLSCISSCLGLSDGDYQSCHDCRLYATCRAGVLNDHRPCPASTYWDDRQKRCVRSSSTCTHFQPEAAHAQHSATQPEVRRRRDPHDCIESCDGVRDGDYHSCRGCSEYASCIRGHFFGGRTCPRGLLWNDHRKQCDYTSGTCTAAASRRAPHNRCMTSCAGMADGDYQSCKGCARFATCLEGVLDDSRPCPGTTVWDDNLKRCLWHSITCR